VITRASRQSVLSPVERQSEILFGLIMALSFTCTLSIAEAGHAEVRTMLWAALGCNTAWGIVDAVMYLLAVLGDRGRNLALFRRFRAAPGPEDANALIREVLPPVLAATLTPGDYDALRARLGGITASADLPRLTLDDFRGALGVFLLVVLSTLPVALPFAVIAEAHHALRVSNAIALLMLFTLGWRLGTYAGIRRPITMAGAMVGIGLACVGITIALGG
jgi:hypothetical protein